MVVSETALRLTLFAAEDSTRPQFLFELNPVWFRWAISKLHYICPIAVGVASA